MLLASKTWLYTCAKRYKIKVCRIAGRTCFDKHDVDAHFGCDIDLSAITEWITTEEATALYGLNKANIHHIAKVNGIGGYNGDYRKIYR